MRFPHHQRRNWSLEPCEPRQLLAGFDITLNYDPDTIGNGLTALFQAKARWEAILLEDIPNVPSGPWGASVDDIRVDVDVGPIDGVGGTLGYADGRYRRNNQTGLPISGMLTVDSDDLSNVGLVDILTHEMGHLLGIGSLWSNFGLVTGVGGSDPQYTGAAALAEYRAYKGDSSLTSVPVENTGALGTRDVHWRESTFARELMTGYYSTGFVNPLSRLSAATLIDIGYPGVNLDAAQAYNLAGGNLIPTIGSVTTSSIAANALTLTANSVADATGVASVRFYRETSGVLGLQASGNVLVKDLLLDTDSTGPTYETTFSTVGLAPGTYTYYAIVTDINGAVSTSVSVTHVVANTPATPLAPSLSAASDSGISNSDRITNITLPTFTGTADANVTVNVFADGVAIGSTTSLGDGTWTFTPTSPIAAGARSITVTAQNANGTSPASSPLLISIDTSAPQISASSFVYLTTLGVSFTFNEAVDASLSGADLVFQNTTNGTPYAATLHSYLGNVATFRFTVFPPPKGDYVATLGAAGVTDVAGNPLAANGTVSFFYLPGDVNQSRSVDFDDLLIFSQHYGQLATFAEGDLNYNGTVDFDDLLMLAQNYGTSLLAAAPAAISSSRRVRTVSIVG